MVPGVLVVELSKGHYELLYSKFRILSPEVKVHFASPLPDRVVEHGVPANLCWPLKGGVFQRFREIRSFCRRENLKVVWINTAEGSQALKLSLLLRIFGYRVFGTVHNAQKFSESWSQRVLGLILNGSLVLTRQIFEHWRSKCPHLSLSYFYACYWPTEARASAENKSVGLRIAVVGQVDQRRRDVEALIRLARELKEKNQVGIQFVILANPHLEEAKKFRDRVESLGLGQCFQFFPERLSHPELLATLNTCHHIALLAHPDAEFSELYRNSKISGAYNLAIGLRRSLLIHEYMKDPEYDPFACYYNLENWSQMLIDLRVHPERRMRLQGAYEQEARFSIEEQKVRVHSFLGTRSED